MAKRPNELDLGDKLEVTLVGGTKQYFEISGTDPIRYRDTKSAVAAGATSAYAEVNNLDPPNGQIYLFQGIEIEGNINLYLKQPAATNRFGTNKSPEGGIIVQSISGLAGPMDIELWVTRDYAPNVQMINNTDVSITPRLTWVGRRFSVKQLASKPSTAYTPIKIGGIAE